MDMQTFSNKLSGITNPELILEVMRVQRQASEQAEKSYNDYTIKEGSRGAVWLNDTKDADSDRHFVSGTGECSCEHYHFRLVPLQDELDKRGIRMRVNCKHPLIAALVHASS